MCIKTLKACRYEVTREGATHGSIKRCQIQIRRGLGDGEILVTGMEAIMDDD